MARIIPASSPAPSAPSSTEQKEGFGNETLPTNKKSTVNGQNNRDAERYRFLRDADPDEQQPYIAQERQNSWGTWRSIPICGEECDVIIDQHLASSVVAGVSSTATGASSLNPPPPSSTELGEIADKAALEISDKLVFNAPMPVSFPIGKCRKIILAALLKASSLKPKTLEET